VLYVACSPLSVLLSSVSSIRFDTGGAFSELYLMRGGVGSGDPDDVLAQHAGFRAADEDAARI
jgi:hypothetical protein